MTDGEIAQRTYSPNAVHLVRTVQTGHLQLSAMADQKASILMGATFVIFTITIGQARSGHAPLPLLVLGAAAFFSAFFAVLAIIPAVHYRGGASNLLFFGAFTQIEESEFIERVLDRLQDDDQVYRTMLHDLYQNGKVLERKKYRLLGYAYRIFLTGLTASFLTFIVEFVAARV